MSTPRARRVAYELLADYAARWKDPGSVRRQGIANVWNACSASEQHDVLDSLSSQIRTAYRTVAAVRDSRRTVTDVDIRNIVSDLCEEARAALVRLVAADPEPWRLPQCEQCRERVAAGLCSLLVQLHAAAGFSSQELANAARAAVAVVTPPRLPPPRQSPERT